MEILYHIGIGLFVGTYGTLVGAGGGFLMVPIFLLVHRLPAEVAVGTSLVVITANAFSGSLTYMLQKKIVYRAGILFALATFPGAYFGVRLSHYFSDDVFHKIFGVFMVAMALFLFFHKRPEGKARLREGWGWRTCTAKENDSTITFSYQEPVGIISSMGIGVISSWLGIGGGIIHVPLMTEILGFPVHAAVATSHFILTCTAFVGAWLHVQQGSWNSGIALWTALGAIAGAQIGARLSKHFQGALILRYLALALGLVGIRLIL